MSPPRVPAAARRRQRGATLAETAIACAVAGVGLTAAVVTLERGQTFTQAATAARLAEDFARGGLSGVFDPLSESSIAFVDTTMRAKTGFTALDGESDRFTVAGATLRQCSASACAVHTKPDLSVDSVRYEAAFERRSGSFGASVVRGAVVPANFPTCPVCGSDTTVGARLDAWRDFGPRNVDGELTTNADGSPFWSGMSVVAPVPVADGGLELRRLDFFASDLVAAPATYTNGFSAFPPTNPSMVDLFDFGTDGATNGVRDGSVPNTLATADSTTETFTTAVGSDGRTRYVVTKTLGVSFLAPYRSLSLQFDLLAGEIVFAATYSEPGGSSWSASGTATRAAKTLVRGLTEFAVSTNASNPYDPATNTSGVAETGVVRITLGTALATEGARTALRRHVERIVVRARNS